jgi:hypothetical protein
MKGTIVQRVAAEASVMANGVITTIRDADAIILRNAGTATVNLFYGLYTLAPGETVSFNATVKDCKIELVDVPVKFDTSTGSDQNLQILTIKSSDC